MSVAFPLQNEQGESLVTKKDNAKTRVNYERHNEQIDTLERRDLYLLDFLSKFDALPIGAIMPTSIPYTAANMPDGWIWADGHKYGKHENMADGKPNLWNAIQSVRESAVITLATYQNTYHNVDPNSLDAPACGKYIDVDTDYFCVPNLNDMFLMSIVSRNTNRHSGDYESDTVGDHVHNIKSYPVNGANLNTSNEIGVALTDKITEKFDTSLDDNYIKNLGMYKTENNNSPSGVETKPKSIAYQFMIKADFTSFDLANTVDTDCASVGGYKPSQTSPEEGNLGERIFPVPDPATGKISSDWFDTTGLATQVLDAAETEIVNMVSTNAVIKDPSVTIDTEDHIAYASNIPGPYRVPLADSEGKINSDYLNIVTENQINSLFI